MTGRQWETGREMGDEEGMMKMLDPAVTVRSLDLIPGVMMS